jgi:hypothetical protein
MNIMGFKRRNKMIDDVKFYWIQRSNLSTRTKNVLLAERKWWSKDMLHHAVFQTPNELLKCPNMGKKGLNELKEWLKDHKVGQHKAHQEKYLAKKRAMKEVNKVNVAPTEITRLETIIQAQHSRHVALYKAHEQTQARIDAHSNQIEYLANKLRIAHDMFQNVSHTVTDLQTGVRTIMTEREKIIKSAATPEAKRTYNQQRIAKLNEAKKTLDSAMLEMVKLLEA